MVIVFLAGSTMSVPPEKRKGPGPVQIQLKEVLGNLPFRILYLAMFTGLAAGFAINANLKELYEGAGNAVRIGITAVSLFAIANAAGRVIWGTLFDWVRSSTAIQLNLLFQAGVLLSAPLILDHVLGFWTVSLLTGFNYGGVLVIYVSSASRLWGAENVGPVYGCLFSSNIPAALSPIVAGMFFDRFDNFDLPLYILAGLLLGGACLVRVKREDVNNGHHFFSSTLR